MKIAQLLRDGEMQLRRSGIQHAGLDVQLLLGHCLNMSRTALLLHGFEPVDKESCNRFLAFLDRRAAHEPVAYILEEREFWSLPFYVNRDVLIPRPETEFLLEMVLQQLAETKTVVNECVDLCCGSGVIAVVLARELGCLVTAVDCSAKALAVTAINAQQLKVAELVKPLRSDLFQALPRDAVFPLIVSNPPYVGSAEIREELEVDVSGFEPHLALDGGQDGLDCIRRMARQVLNHLAPAALFFMEFGADQAEEIQQLFSSSSIGKRFFETITIYQDYSGRDRVLAARVNRYEEHECK